MWKKIDTNEIAFKIKEGDKVSQSPPDPTFEFVTRVIRNGFISLVGVNTTTSVRLIPLVLLKQDNWWTKK